MRFFSAAAAVLAFAASALAQTADFDPVYSPAEGTAVQAGQPFKVTWSAPAKYQSGTIKIHLIGGADANTLVPIGEPLVTGLQNSALSWTWNVASNLGDKAAYGLVFTWEADTSIYQYSQRFSIKGGVASSSAAVTASATAPVVTASGVKTVTLTSCPPDVVTSAAPGNGTASWTTKISNSTVVPTYKPTGALPTTTKGSVPTGSSAPIPTAAAPHVGAGIVAVFGGVAAALLL
ncbi:unnamed protein product [Clonostachys rosea f. rosea IK726]|jgi:hypothetical protein|uniref:Yeast cell wall synthesis Kre9/Knh1-like N-terminal domain-containing protein n=2 Tax=Bionectria ochroleuca TaxID=29856 RepID=A0A0B7JUF2_BIOOC|nr:unnamed protein product [Clonostachys rosea f. rosea IK726]